MPGGAWRSSRAWRRKLDGLRTLGHDAVVAADEHDFGVGQCVLVEGEALVGGSDGRGDGAAGGF